MKHKVVSRISDGIFRYQAWPTITKDKDGVLYVGVSGHRLNHICPFGKDLMYVSTDEGETWSAPQIINDTYLDDRDAGMLAWGDGHLLLTWFSQDLELYRGRQQFEHSRAHQTTTGPLAVGAMDYVAALPEGTIEVGSFTKISHDNGKTWSEKHLSPLSSPHGPCLLNDGTLLYVGTIVSKDGKYMEDKMDMTKRIQAWTSKDFGETWEQLSYLPIPENFDKASHEPYAIQLNNGDILAAVRFQNKTGPSRAFMSIYTTVSHDGGKTWEPAQYTGIDGAPPHLLQHSSGAVIMVYSQRCASNASYARVSYDNGKTWSEEKKIGLDSPDWDHGYPSTVELSNGDLLTVYYQKCPGDTYNSVHSVRYSLDELK